MMCDPAVTVAQLAVSVVAWEQSPSCLKAALAACSTRGENPEGLDRM
jgi:hypothetical protein